MDDQSGIEKALEKFGGSPTKLANAINAAGGSVIRQHIEHWVKAKKVPADKAIEVFSVTGVPVQELAPDTRWEMLAAQPQPAQA